MYRLRPNNMQDDTRSTLSFRIRSIGARNDDFVIPPGGAVGTSSRDTPDRYLGGATLGLLMWDSIIATQRIQRSLHLRIDPELTAKKKYGSGTRKTSRPLLPQRPLSHRRANRVY